MLIPVLLYLTPKPHGYPLRSKCFVSLYQLFGDIMLVPVTPQRPLICEAFAFDQDRTPNHGLL